LDCDQWTTIRETWTCKCRRLTLQQFTDLAPTQGGVRSYVKSLEAVPRFSATKKHRESLDNEIRAQTVPATLFQLAELGFAQRAEVLAHDNASVLPADTAMELIQQDFEHTVNLIASAASQREAAAAIETRHQVSSAKCSANTNEEVVTGAAVAVHEFDLHDDVMITYDGRDIRVCVSRRIESKRGSGTRYDINFPGDQWELDSDGRKTGARITTLKGVPADRLALAPTRRCRRPRQRHW